MRVSRLLQMIVCTVTTAYGYVSCTGAVASELTSDLRVQRFISNSTVDITHEGRSHVVRLGQRYREWTFMGIARGDHEYAIFEDFQDMNGPMLFVDGAGIQIELGKSAASDIRNPRQLFLGRSCEQVASSAEDVLGESVLAKSGDPGYGAVQDVLPKPA